MKLTTGGVARRQDIYANIIIVLERDRIQVIVIFLKKRSLILF